MPLLPSGKTLSLCSGFGTFSQRKGTNIQVMEESVFCAYTVLPKFAFLYSWGDAPAQAGCGENPVAAQRSRMGTANIRHMH